MLKIKKLAHCADVPSYKTEGSSGMDLVASVENDVEIKPFERKLIPTGIMIELPKDHEAQIRARSGLSIKHGITLVNAVGTIDEDYRGEICVPAINLSNESYTIKRGDRIAQMIIMKVEKLPVELTEELSTTVRGAGGFGSTGVKG